MEQQNILDWLLSRPDSAPAPIASLTDWKQRFEAETAGWSRPVERAIAGGWLADRVAYAFMAGYQSALRALVPDLPGNQVTALCVTEDGGGHPRAIKTRLERSGSGWLLSGSKQFVTAADEAALLLVAASTDQDADGRNLLRMARVARDAVGVRVERGADLAFIPEISHGVVHFDGVALSDSALLPGDGYTGYVKPFRTVEDLHVFAALLAYLYRAASTYGWPNALRERIAALLTGIGALADADPLAPSVHIALGGIINQMGRVLEVVGKYWPGEDEQSAIRWARDQALLGVGANVREQRLEAAWKHYAG